MKTLKNNFVVKKFKNNFIWTEIIMNLSLNSFWDEFLGKKRKRVTGYRVTKIVWFMGNGK